ncbi:hypothetical protein ACFLVO_00355 [Chloroflexota bacterium]
MKIPRLPYIGGFFGKKRIRIVGIPLGLLVVFYVFYNLHELQPNEWVEISLLAGLVAATGALAVYAAGQAYASVKMTEEMREQRIMASRPAIIQRAVPAGVISTHTVPDHFEIYNAGNGPAIEVEVSLLRQREPPYNAHYCQREGFLRAGDPPIKFNTTFPPDIANSTFYIVSEYQGISSQGQKPTWYQTWLPCKLSVSCKVISGRLEFLEVPEDKRIGIFKSEFSNGSVTK